MKRNITTHSSHLEPDIEAWVEQQVSKTARIKTYVHQRFGGTGNIHNLSLATIRRLMKESGVYQWLCDGMAVHSCDMAIKRTTGELKSEHTNRCKLVKSYCRERTDLDPVDRLYITIILGRPELLSGVFNCEVPSPTLNVLVALNEADRSKRVARLAKKPRRKTNQISQERPSAIDRLLAHSDIGDLTPARLTRLWSLIRRYYREVNADSSNRVIQPSVFYIDSSVASWTGHELKITRRLSGTKANVPRVSIAMQAPSQGKMTETILRYDKRRSRITAYKSVSVRRRVLVLGRRSIGVDKGYRDLLTSSDGRSYGEGHRRAITPMLAVLTEKQRRRQRYHARYRALIAAGKTDKAKRVLENNLGTGRWTKLTERHREHKRSLINRGLNDLFSTHDFDQLVVEDLSHPFGKRKGKVSLSRQMKGELSQWDRGYLQERIEFKAFIMGVDVVLVNPAYTSQQCHLCHKIGNRQGRQFTCTNSACTIKHYDADVNAAKTILNRKDAAIELWMSPSTVRSIIDAL